MPEGQEVDYDPAAFNGVSPIIALSETIRPRLVLVIRPPSGGDFLFSLLYDREKGAYQKRGRLRNAQGGKEEFAPGKWVRLTAPEEVTREIEKALRSAERIVKELGGTISKIEFVPQATEEEILAAFVENGSFDVLRLDPETKKAKKLK